MAWSAAPCVDDNKMTTPITTIKICAFFFTGLYRSRLTDIDWIKNATWIRNALKTDK